DDIRGGTSPASLSVGSPPPFTGEVALKATEGEHLAPPQAAPLTTTLRVVPLSRKRERSAAAPSRYHHPRCHPSESWDPTLTSHRTDARPEPELIPGVPSKSSPLRGYFVDL